MKSFNEFSEKLLDSDAIIKKFGKSAADNIGKLIAFTVALIAVAVTFTDISFRGFFTEDFLGSLLLLITSAYIIYFSLEDAGEKTGALSDEYTNAKRRYDEIRSNIRGTDIERLREFCKAYSEREADSRRSMLIFSHGLTVSGYKEYTEGKKFPKKVSKIFCRAAKIKPAPLNIKTLLSSERCRARCELENPEKRKILNLILKLLPSTVCMFITVSVILDAKENMGLSDILNSILKLSALPVSGFRGYSAGYSYAKHSLSLWMETKANILEAFTITKA